MTTPGPHEPTADRIVLASLRRGKSERETMLKALGELYVAGYPVDWRKQHPTGGKCVPLPGYPWQRKRHWLETPVAAPPARTESGLPNWFYNVEWELRSRFFPTAAPRRAASFQAPAEIAARVRSRVDAVGAGFGLARTGGLLAQLDAASRAFAVAALAELGLSFRNGDCWEFRSSESLADHLRIRPHYARLVGRLTEMCETDGLLAREATGWRVVRELPAADPRRDLARLGNQYPEWQAVFRILERCGLSLSRVLKGESSPLPLLFSDDSTSSAERIYQDVPFARAANTLIAETIDAAVANLPAAQSLAHPGNRRRHGRHNGIDHQPAACAAGGIRLHRRLEVVPRTRPREVSRLPVHAICDARHRANGRSPGRPGIDLGWRV